MAFFAAYPVYRCSTQKSAVVQALAAACGHELVGLRSDPGAIAFRAIGGLV
jgi:hypothetical protein